MSNEKKICLTLDLECDYGTVPSRKTYQCLEKIDDLIDILSSRDIPLTCFVQTSILQSHPHVIEKLKNIDVEFEPHSHDHIYGDMHNGNSDIVKSIEVYKEFFNKNPVGYRFPNGVIESSDYNVLEDMGIKYDSSIFPSWRPGHFNNTSQPIKSFYPENTSILEIPFTVLSSKIRIPIALSYIKLFGPFYPALIEKLSLPNPIIFDFHLHDLIDSNAYNDLPPFYKIIYGHNRYKGLHYLIRFIEHMQKENYNFIKMSDLFTSLKKTDI